MLAEHGYKVTKDLAFDCLLQVAMEHQFDPVKAYLEFVSRSVPPTYIEALATEYLRPDDKPGTLYDEMIKRTLIAAVKRCYEPGSKHDTACVLMGDQGARKSSFWNVLGGEFFSDSLKDIGSKDDLMILHQSWIMEWAELDHLTGKKHAGQVKAFLSQHTDMFRVPYGKATEAFPRRGIVVGSTNKSTGFLVDETGNRRFWVIPTPLDTQRPIDTATLALERDAIWSGAVAAYKAGESSFLTAQRETEVAEENGDYLVTHPWLPAIESWLLSNLGSPITSEAILTNAVMKPVERQTKSDQMQVADVLRRLGYERRRIRHGGGRSWVWERI
jgi:predicted P-loop ATPase